MKVDNVKNKTPLGDVLSKLEEWQRLKIKASLFKLGFTEGKWRGLIERVEAYNLPGYVRDVVVKELPETTELFNHPNLK